MSVSFRGEAPANNNSTSDAVDLNHSHMYVILSVL